MRLVFMGTPDFSVPVLRALHDVGHEICAVYCQPPRPAGRGKKERLTPVHQAAIDLGLLVRHPTSLKSKEEQQEFAKLNADGAVVVAYGLLLPQPILDAPKYGCLNIHASLLPRWRGAAPIHRAILAGDTRTGVCIMQMETGLDTGPVLMKQETKIAPTDTTQILHDRLSKMGADLILLALDQITQITPQPQPQDGVCYAHKIDKAEAAIDWSKSAIEIDRKIRGLSPFPGAWTTYQGDRIKCLMSNVVENSMPADENVSNNHGQIIEHPLVVQCARGRVALTILQRAGKSAQGIDVFLRGVTLKVGDRLGD